MLKKVSLKNGEEIAYRERDGGEKVVILVHGNMSSSKHWDLLIDVLDPSYKLYAIDLRGFGLSSYHTRITSIRDFSDDLKGFVDEFGLDDFHLIGWSTGGAVCMQFTADYPGLCSKVVLLASASTRGYPIFAMNADGTPNLEQRLTTIEEVEKDARTIGMQGLYDTANREGLKQVWNAVIYTDNQPTAEKYEEYIDDMLTQRNLADVYQALNTFNISAYGNGLNTGKNEVSKINVPVLILQGERDYVVTENMAQEIVADLGDVAQFVSLKDCGHSPMVDDLEQLKKEIENFLE